MKDYDKKNEELLIEMARQEKIKNKKIITIVWFTIIVSIVFYVGIVLIAALTLKEELILGTIIVIATALLITTLFYTFKIENETGYYECKKCHHRFAPNYFTSLIAPHLFITRYLKCPKCNKKSWSKKVLTKE